MLLQRLMKRSHLYQAHSWIITAISGIRLRISDNLQTTWHLFTLLHQYSGVLEIVNARIVHVDNNIGLSGPNEFVVSFDLLCQIIVLNGDDRQGVRRNAGRARDRAELRATIVTINIDRQIVEEWSVPFFCNLVAICIGFFFVITHHGEKHVAAQGSRWSVIALLRYRPVQQISRTIRSNDHVSLFDSGVYGSAHVHKIVRVRVSALGTIRIDLHTDSVRFIVRFVSLEPVRKQFEIHDGIRDVIA